MRSRSDQPCSSRAEIRAALECGGFSGRDAICAPPMNVCELRGLNVPPGSEQERRTMIARRTGAKSGPSDAADGIRLLGAGSRQGGKGHRRVQRERAGHVAAVGAAAGARLPAGGLGLLGGRRRAAGDGPGRGAGRRAWRRAAGAGRRLGLFEYDAVHRGRRPAAVRAADSRLCVWQSVGFDHARCSA